MADDRLLVEYEVDGAKVKLTEGIVYRFLTNGRGNFSPEDVMMFMKLCEARKLNPFTRECYLIKYSNDVSQPAQMVVSRDVFRKRAITFTQFNGMQTGVIIQKDGELIEREGSMSLDGEEIVGGWATGWRKDWDHPHKVTVALREYIGKKSNGDVNKMWSEKTGTMIAKVAESQLLRAMVPEQLSGLYTAEEVNAENLPTEKVEVSVTDVSAQGDVDELRRDIIQQLEDAKPYLVDGYIDALTTEMDTAETIADLEEVRDKVKSEVNKARKAEARATTKEKFDETVAKLKKDADGAEPDDQADLEKDGPPLF